MSSRYSGGVVRKNQLVPTTSSASGVWNLGEATQATKADIWPYANIAMPISQSLRFRASASAYLSRTFGTPTSGTTWTWSGWVKLGTIPSQGTLFEAGTGASNTFHRCTFGQVSAELNWRQVTPVGGLPAEKGTTQLFRDPSAWYHIVCVWDTNNATSSDRQRVYVNGVRVTSFSANTEPSSGLVSYFNTASYVHYLGVLDIGGLGAYLDGYMADVNFVDGQALDSSYFGQTSAITGVWEPKQYSGTYGANGFHLEFKDTTVGQDTSGNNNDWTPNNISTTLGSTYDLMKDVPTQFSPRGTTDVGGTVRGNYCTFNPLDKNYYTTQAAPLDGNMRLYGLGGRKTNFGITTGKWYVEFTLSGGGTPSANFPCIGLRAAADDGYWCGYASNSVGYQQGGTVYYNGNTVAQATGQSFTTGDVLGMAYDADTNRVWFAKNGTWIGTGSPNPATNTSPIYTFSSSAERFIAGDTIDSSYGGLAFNAGQRPFTYTPPSGFKSLCTTNLPTPTIGATVATAANKYFDATLYNGTGATLSVTNAGGFQPDFVWLKSRSAATNHQVFDTVRGATKVSVINAAEAESTSANTITSFNSNGFTVGTNTAINTSSATYVAWQWWAGGSTVTNTTGSISAQVRASTTTGFSIATYTGNGTGGATIGHGLGAAPSMLIFRNRDAADNSALVWHTGFNTNQGQMLLSSTAAVYNPGNGLYFNSTTPGSSVVTLGTSGGTNGSGSNMIMYAWTPIAGFSAFGSYTGNGSADGPFVYTGFRPKFIMTKNASAIGNWELQDTSRATSNIMNAILQPNLPDVEAAAGRLDGLSSGFKIRTSSDDLNTSGSNYIYMAFAENPFKNSLAR
jgi:hypothetical protein